MTAARHIWLVPLLIGGLLTAAPPSLAASSSAKTAPSAPDKATVLPAPIIAIVDMQRILEESLAAKSVQQQLETQRARFQATISGEEEDLRKAEQELTKLRSSASADVYAEKEQELRHRFLSVERHVQARRKALDQAFADSMNVVRKNLLDVVKTTAQARGANIVIVKQQALWSDAKMDLTDEVLTRLNALLPQVQVKVVPDDDTKKPSGGPPSSAPLKKQSR